MGNSYYNICKHDDLTMQVVKGDGLSQNDYVEFKCSCCHLHCFQYRQRGQFFNGPWYPWCPRNDESKKEIGPLHHIGSSNLIVCLHSNMRITGSKGNTGQGCLEIANMKCPDCNLDCQFERQLGTIYNGPWQKAGYLLSI